MPPVYLYIIIINKFRRHETIIPASIILLLLFDVDLVYFIEEYD